MTNHYTLEILKTQTCFKITYRDGKFRKLEHLRGTLQQDIVNYLGNAIPVNENDFNAFKDTFANRVSYELVQSEKSQYSQFLAAWNVFYKDAFNIIPKFTGADGNALKSIISYLNQVNKTEAEALEVWRVILSKWQTLNEFHQKNTDLKYINSKLNLIINEVKQQGNTYAAGAGRNVRL